MNDLEMELQTIRRKLQTLKASPPETVATPWKQSKHQSPSPDFRQVQTAIETLRQRSEQPHTLATVPTSTLEQFEQLLSTIETLAQQQQQTLKRLHRVGDSLMVQTPPGSSPDVDEIFRFLADCPAIQIPTIGRTSQGYLDINYRVVDFQQVKYDDSSNTTTLRTRSRLFQHAFSTDLNSTKAHHNHSLAEDKESYPGNRISNVKTDWKNVCQRSVRSVRRWVYRQSNIQPHQDNVQFNLLDNATWCLGATIFRVILSRVLQVYPALWTPVALIVVVGVIFSLYSSLFSPTPNPTAGYRTLMVILGLALGGRFSQ